MLTFTEIMIIIVAFVLILVFGEKKIPRLGRALGSFLKEFREGARKGYSGADDKIMRLAKELGIETEGKSEEEIIEEIRRRAAERR